MWDDVSDVSVYTFLPFKTSQGTESICEVSTCYVNVNS